MATVFDMLKKIEIVFIKMKKMENKASINLIVGKRSKSLEKKNVKVLKE